VIIGPSIKIFFINKMKQQHVYVRVVFMMSSFLLRNLEEE